MWRFWVWLLPIFLRAATSEPSIVSLTWIGDPTTSMVVQWHAKAASDPCQIRFRLSGSDSWTVIGGEIFPIPTAKEAVFQVSLTELLPGHEYEFSIYDKIYRFHTLSAEQPLRFVVGGDCYTDFDRFQQMSYQVKRLDPDFIVLGGDIAYAYGHFWASKSGYPRWKEFFQHWHQIFSADGRLIPVLAAVGNHDVKKGNKKTQKAFELFFPKASGCSYGFLEVSDFLRIWFLDTGHVSPIAGEQTRWLQEQLQNIAPLPYQCAVYHMAGYPSVYGYDRDVPKLIRRHWSPLFEAYHISVVFENHNHAYKRTFPLKEERMDSTGVTYIGDGSWGVPPRKLSNERKGVFAKALSANTVSLVTLSQEQMRIQMISLTGESVDEVTIPKIAE